MAPTNIYAAVADVQALISSASGSGLTIGSGSTPTTTQVEGFLDQIAAEIDSLLRAKGYGTIPATGTNDKLLLRRYTALGAAVLTWRSAFGGYDDTERIKAWADEYKAFIERLSKNDARLIDQAPLGKVGVVLVSRYTGEDE